MGCERNGHAEERNPLETCRQLEQKNSLGLNSSTSDLPGEITESGYLYEAEKDTGRKSKEVNLPRGVRTSENIVSDYAKAIKEHLSANSFGIDSTRTSVSGIGEVYNQKMWDETRLEDRHPDERSVTYTFGVALGKALRDELQERPRHHDSVKLAHAVLQTNGAAGSYHEGQEGLMKKGAMDSQEVIRKLEED